MSLINELEAAENEELIPHVVANALPLLIP